MTFVNQKTLYVTGAPWLTVGELRKVLANVIDDDATVSYGVKTGEHITGLSPWMIVGNLREEIAAASDEDIVEPSDNSLSGHHVVIEVVQEDVFGQIVRLTEDEARAHGFSEAAIAQAKREDDE